MEKYTKELAREVLAKNMQNTAYQNEWDEHYPNAPVSAEQMRSSLIGSGFGIAETETIIASLVLAGAHFTMSGNQKKRRKKSMTVEELRKEYPKGTKIWLNYMEGEYHMPFGLLGTVKNVDDMGQIHMEWENGSTLALAPEKDSFQKQTDEGTPSMYGL